MDIRVWRIAATVCGLCSLAFVALLAYQIVWLGNAKAFTRVRNDPLEWLLILALMNALLAGLISFPYYWARGMLWLAAPTFPALASKASLSKAELPRYLLGLAASCLCIGLVLLLKRFVRD